MMLWLCHMPLLVPTGASRILQHGFAGAILGMAVVGPCIEDWAHDSGTAWSCYVSCGVGRAKSHVCD